MENGCASSNGAASAAATAATGCPVSSSSSSSSSTKMGIWAATSYVIGNIIGSGIFITPASIVRSTGSIGLSIVVWLLCAIIAVLGSLCYIELGTSIREAGCDFAYICFMRWDAVAFSFMWVSVLMTYPATIAICSETFAQYTIEGFRQVYDIDETLVPVAQKLLGFSLLWLVCWMNFFPLGKFAARFQIAATVAKLFACLLIICTGFYFYFFKGWTENLDGVWRGSVLAPGHLVLGFYGGLWAFSGWDILNYGTNEIANPKKNVPLALLSGICIVTAVYIAINLAFYVALDVDEVKSSNAVAALFGRATLGRYAYTIPFLIGILLLGSLNSNLFSSSRYMYAAARARQLPSCFSCVNIESDSPRVAIFAQTLLAMAISWVGDLDALIGYVMFGFWAQRLFTLAALLLIRHRSLPVHADAVRVPLWVIYSFTAITLALVVVPIVQEFGVTMLGLAISLAGFAFYHLVVAPNRLPPFCRRLDQAALRVCCIVFNAFPDLSPAPPGGGPGAGLRSRAVSLQPSDSQQALLVAEANTDSPSPQVRDDDRTWRYHRTQPPSPTLDLHSDEKNILIRSSSGSALKFWRS